MEGRSPARTGLFGELRRSGTWCLFCNSCRTRQTIRTQLRWYLMWT